MHAATALIPMHLAEAPALPWTPHANHVAELVTGTSDAKAPPVDWMIQTKKPPRCGPEGGKQKQTHTFDVGNNYDPKYNKVHVITTDVHPHHSAWLGWEPGDDHARSSALLPWVGQNAYSAPILSFISLPSPAPVIQNILTSLKSTLMHSMKLGQLSPCLPK